MNQDIIHIATDNLRKAAGIEARWRDGGAFDGILEITVNNKRLQFDVEVRGEPRIHQIHQLADHAHHKERVMLIANRLLPNVKLELRKMGLPYLEANGNVYISMPGFYLHIETQKPLGVKKNHGNRAFTKTGLKVLFHLLQHKEDVNLTQRELADRVGVALGNIPQVIEGLKKTGHLIPLNNREYVWDKMKALLDQWIDGYATQLRPKLIKERYALKGNWHDVKLDNALTVWGGEPAADMLTNHLRPEKFIVFTKEGRVDLIKKYQLMPDHNGDIEVLDMFWTPTGAQTAPPILVYADLLLEGGKRNTETAEKIFDEYIQPNI